MHLSDDWKVLESLSGGLSVISFFKVFGDVLTESVKDIVITSGMIGCVVLYIVDYAIENNYLVIFFVAEIVFHHLIAVFKFHCAFHNTIFY